MSETTTEQPLSIALTEAWRLGQATEIIGATETAVFVSRQYQGTEQVARIAADDGTVEWQTTEFGTLSTGAAVGDGLFAGTAEEPVFYAIEQETGEKRWHARMNGALPPIVEATEEIVVVGSPISDTGFGGELRGFDPVSGGQQFNRPNPLKPRSVKIKGDLVVSQGDSGLYGYETETGSKRWKSGSALGPGAFTQSYVAFPATGGTVKALDAVTGEEMWENTRGWPTQYDILTSAASADTFVFNARANESRDHLYAFDAESGTQRWMTERRAIHDIQIRDGLCFVLHDALEVFDVNSGQQRARIEPPTEKETMILTDDHVILGPDSVVAYRL